MPECLNCLGNPGGCTCTPKQISRDDVEKVADRINQYVEEARIEGTTTGTELIEAAAMLRSLWDELEELKRENCWVDSQDREDDLSPAIKAAHPVNKNENCKHYDRAMELVGNRKSKGSLVEMTCYFLAQLAAANERLAKAERELEGLGKGRH